MYRESQHRRAHSIINAERCLLALAIAMLASCDGRLIAAGNLGLAVVPCVLLWVTVNLKKSR